MLIFFDKTEAGYAYKHYAYEKKPCNSFTIITFPCIIDSVLIASRDHSKGFYRQLEEQPLKFCRISFCEWQSCHNLRNLLLEIGDKLAKRISQNVTPQKNQYL